MVADTIEFRPLRIVCMRGSGRRARWISNCVRGTMAASLWGFHEYRGFLEPPFPSHVLGVEDQQSIVRPM